jgi:D-glycero-alpha-D-manno-heptose-7-phosphate kinase
VIISRTPFRISFAGGGSDLPAYYREEEGMVLSTSIDKYMYISLHPYFHAGHTLLKYSKTELVEDIDEIKHPIIREAMRLFGTTGVDISSTADIPAGTGLGSSSTFTVGLLHTLAAHNGRYASKEFLGATACDIEINRLKEPIGKQDQYAAAYGGLNFITFLPDETVNIERLVLNPAKFKELQDNLMMFYTGDVRSASLILKEQSSNTSGNSGKRDNLRKMVRLAQELRRELEQNNIDAMGEVLHQSWIYKKELATGISNPRLDSWYEAARRAGASGGKLLGAGGGGFLLFYVPKERQEAVRAALGELRSLDFRFDQAGSVIVYNN